MDEFLKEHSKNSFFIGVMISFLLCFAGIKYGLGMFIGVVMAQLNMRLMSLYINDMLFFRRRNRVGSYLFFTFGILLLGIPLAMGAVYPHYFNIFTAAFGVLLFKIELITKEVFLFKKEE